MYRYSQALQIAAKAHKGQKDKAGEKYIFHPFHVAKQFRSETLKIVAILHDVLEDTTVTMEDLEHYGFSQPVLDALCAITKKPNQSYEEYITGVKKNDLARLVKIEDIKHNMDVSRLKKVTQQDRQRVARYEKALRYLTDNE